MPKVMRQGVLAIVRQLVAGRMPQHVRVHSEGEARRAAGALKIEGSIVVRRCAS